MRLDAIPESKSDQVGLQVLSIQPPQGAWPVPGHREAGQVDRRNCVAHSPMFSSHIRRSQRLPAATRQLGQPETIRGATLSLAALSADPRGTTPPGLLVA